MFGRGIQSSVNQQIVIYVFARVVLAMAQLSIQKRSEGGVGMGRELRERVRGNAWPVFASLSWAMVMWLFRWYPETIQPSLRSSMKYMYVAIPPTSGSESPFGQSQTAWRRWYSVASVRADRVRAQIRRFGSLGRLQKLFGAQQIESRPSWH